MSKKLKTVKHAVEAYRFGPEFAKLIQEHMELARKTKK